MAKEARADEGATEPLPHVNEGVHAHTFAATGVDAHTGPGGREAGVNSSDEAAHTFAGVGVDAHTSMPDAEARRLTGRLRAAESVARLLALLRPHSRPSTPDPPTPHTSAGLNAIHAAASLVSLAKLAKAQVQEQQQQQQQNPDGDVLRQRSRPRLFPRTEPQRVHTPTPPHPGSRDLADAALLVSRLVWERSHLLDGRGVANCAWAAARLAQALDAATEGVEGVDGAGVDGGRAADGGAAPARGSVDGVQALCFRLSAAASDSWQLCWHLLSRRLPGVSPGPSSPAF